jgi:hypothetical protein
MKSDGSDQMNTVANTAEYPLERWERRCDNARSVRGGAILEFMSVRSGPAQRMFCALVRGIDPSARKVVR